MKLGKIEVHSGFLLLWAWLFYRDSSGVVWQALLACLLHELGHCMALMYFQKDIKGISFTVYGGELFFDAGLSYAQELVTAAAGPGINLLLAYLFCTFSWGRTFAGVNLALALFNLLPVGRLDGARVLGCVLALLGSDRGAQHLGGFLIRSFTALFLLLGLYLALTCGNLTLFLMCLWVVNGQLRKKTCKISGKESD